MLSNNKIAFVDYLSNYKNKLSEIVIWDKSRSQPAMAENVLNSEFEFILIFGKENATRKMPGKFRGTISNIYHGKPQSENDLGTNIHAATMPLDLADWVIDNFSNNYVYDPFLGSGTTLIACERLNRKCRAVEISPAYVAVAIERWHQMTGLEPVLVEDK